MQETNSGAYRLWLAASRKLNAYLHADSDRQVGLVDASGDRLVVAVSDGSDVLAPLRILIEVADSEGLDVDVTVVPASEASSVTWLFPPSADYDSEFLGLTPAE